MVTDICVSIIIVVLSVFIGESNPQGYGDCDDDGQEEGAALA